MDYIHMRWLVGSVANWDDLFAQAYRALRPGGWLESFESDGVFLSDDGTLSEKSALSQWGKIFTNFGETTGRPFTVIENETQDKAMRAAGFADIGMSDLKVRKWRPPRQALQGVMLVMTNCFPFRG
ncbi:hypothetical protein IMZ48_29445 [Candidatus Bathyarchaeota archaeon]|nr:hypothetical protein [Candidatus Bathyarchaeota archaeon]